MMKETFLVEQAVAQVRGILAEVPFVRISEPDLEFADLTHEVDFSIKAKVSGREKIFVCEVKSRGQPKTVRGGAAQLRLYCERLGSKAYGIFIAPFLSSSSQEICKEYDIGFVDLEGNCRIVFDNVYIERVAATKPRAEQRELRSLFAPRSSQVLHVLLRDPNRFWKVVDLAEEAGVSIGHVSNVRRALIEREWGHADAEGLRLTHPNELLDQWKDEYRPPAGDRHKMHTTMHGKALQDAIRRALIDAPLSGKVMMASFTASQWLSPFIRGGSDFFYADHEGYRYLRSHLELTPVPRGENIVVTELDDPGLFRHSIKVGPGIHCTSPVQTYLDLYISGDRGREAAEHLRRERLQWNSY